MNRIMLFCSLLTISFSAMSEPQYWMKKDDPNSLGLFVSADSECPFKKSDLEQLAEGEFLRARIKPTKNPYKLNITLTASCLKITQESGQHMGYALTYSIDFSIRMTEPNKALVAYEDSYAYGGILASGSNKGGAKTYFLTTIRESLSIAITDYLKANLE
jgi:hypothetical protein